MDVNSVSGKFCFLLKRYTWSVSTAYFLLIFQPTVGAQVYFLLTTKNSVSKILEEDTTNSSWIYVYLILYIGLVLAVSIGTISFMVALPIGLYKDDTRLTKIYWKFFSGMLALAILFCTVCDFTLDVNPIMATHKILLLVYTFLPFMMSSYWMNLAEDSEDKDA